MEDECFGGSYGNEDNDNWGSSRYGEKTRSAYMLIYERKPKFPIKIVVKEEDIKNRDSIISFKKDEQFALHKKFDILKNIDSTEYDLILEKLLSSYFYDAEKNEFYCYKSFYSFERLLPKNYYLQVLEDNSSFQKLKNSTDEKYVAFLDSVMNCFESTISELNEIKEETNTKILMIFLNFIYNILSNKDKQNLLKSTKDKFLYLLDNTNNYQQILIAIVFNYLSDNLQSLKSNILNESFFIIDTHTELLFELVRLAFKVLQPNDFEEFIKMSETNKLAKDLLNVLDLIVNLFPKLPNNIVCKSSPILKLLRKVSELSDVFIEYLISKECIFKFITFILGKESPCYQETFSKPNENWDINRSSPNNINDFIVMLSNIILKNDSCINKLSDRDLKCIKHPNFLKEIYKLNPYVFSELTIKFSFNDYEFTLTSCREILKNIDEVVVYDDNEIHKLFNSILPILAINDDLQRIRFELLVGYPQMLMDELNMKYNMPYFGFNKMTDKESKLYEFKSLIQNKQSCCLIKKIYNLRYREKICSEIFIEFLEEAVKNQGLLKYIIQMPSEEPLHKNFITWGSHIIKRYISIQDGEPELQNRLGKVLSNIDNYGDLINDESILPSFFGFADYLPKTYLPYEVKREKVSMIYSADNLIIFRIEYFTTYLEFKTDMSFSNSKASMMYYSKNSEDYKNMSKENIEENIEEEVKTSMYNLNEDLDKYTLIDIKSKPKNEKEFFRKILISLSSDKSVIVQNTNLIPKEEPQLSVIRFVVYNNSQRDANISFSLKKKDSSVKFREFIPEGVIHQYISQQNIKNLLIIKKVKREESFNDVDLDFDYDVNIEWSHYRTMQSHYSNEQINNYNQHHIRTNQRGKNSNHYPLPGISQYYNQVYTYGQGGYNHYPLSSNSNIFTAQNSGTIFDEIDYNPTVYDEEDENSEFLGKQRH